MDIGFNPRIAGIKIFRCPFFSERLTGAARKNTAKTATLSAAQAGFEYNARYD
tara:strand:- start:677 stop:835 length:159 start_codon:yes stop_codon:yes gene_type:complete